MGTVQQLWKKRIDHYMPNIPKDVYAVLDKSGYYLIMTINGELTPEHRALAQAFSQLNMFVGWAHESRTNGEVVQHLSYIAIQTIGGFTLDPEIITMPTETRLKLIKQVKDELKKMNIAFGP
jgi:hypothetical protein